MMGSAMCGDVAWKKHLFVLLLVAVVGLQVAANEQKILKATQSKFVLPSITRLDDPRLINPWAALPLPHQASRKLQEREYQELEEYDYEYEPEDEDEGQTEEGEQEQEDEAPTTATTTTTTTTTTKTAWDVIVVGAGPGGITAAKTILDKKPTTSILILERGPSVEQYKAKGYDDALMYNAATADPEFREDVPGTPIVVGTGVGGGTNHFGMQFIDQEAVADASARQPTVSTADLRPDVHAFGNLTAATSYTDEDFEAVSPVVSDTYLSLMDEINAQASSFQGKLYRNKVYKTGTDINHQPRLILGDLLSNKTYVNLQIQTGMEVLKLLPKGTDTTQNGVVVKMPNAFQETYYSDHIILAAGALNSARLALNANIAQPTGQSSDGRPFLGPVWDHHGLVVSYYAPGTQFTTSSSSSATEYSVDLGLTVFSSIEEARTDTTGFLAFLTIPVLTSQQDIDALKAGTWTGSEPQGTDLYSYIFDLGDFFTSRHPGGDITAIIAENNYDIGFVMDSFAPDSHKVNKLTRLVRSGGRLLGILTPSSENDNNASTTIVFDYSMVDVAGDRIIGHLQTRPDDMDWQYYYVTSAGANMIIGVSTTGELIEDDGKVYAGDALGPNTVELPSLKQSGFDAIMEGIRANHEILTSLGYFTQMDIDAITDMETLENTPGYLASTYHYHGTLSQTSLAPGFYAGDLSRMKFKWAGSISVAAGAMGIQAGKEVLCHLDSASCTVSHDDSGMTTTGTVVSKAEEAQVWP